MGVLGKRGGGYVAGGRVLEDPAPLSLTAAPELDAPDSLRPEPSREPWLPEPRARGQSAIPAGAPHVLVMLPAARAGAAGLIARLGDDVKVTLLENDGAIPELSPVDVAVIHAECMGLACSPLLRDPGLGLPELVFLVDEMASPQHLALRSRGFRHVVAERDLSSWLPAQLGQLVALTRARRILLVACADGPGAIDVPGPVRHALHGGLHAAETSFRKTFMRTLLAEHGSRRRAAEEAGVPYRSFCEMLRKLGL